MSGEKSARRVLIVTVGQTAAPIEAALAHHAPDGVVFIASQGSHTVAAELVSAFKGEFLHYTLLLNDPESLKESYQQALAALRQALAWDAQTITADLTGGTKPMVAGLALALSGRGVTFSYVGGEQRDEYGRVRSGTEQMRLLEDPTTRFHVREWEALQRAWNAWRFQDVQEQLSRILARPLSPSEQHFFEHLRGVVQGLEAWDTFHH
ncbi:MAG: TIGR02710 family CRISPR-associated protein, partial [Truepera sp.]|nr:TIGR02710 family CRISPR-associated protein [Truepera sp.]